MLRATREMVDIAYVKICVGMIIGFPEGTQSLAEKLSQVQQTLH
ncbi:MAG: hypothetical protein ABI045_07145 [Flavobacteriales bacterium]